MNWNYYLYAGIIFLTSACQKVEEPYQLSDEKWTNLLTDIHISESATQHLSLSLRDSMVNLYLDQVLEIHEVEKTIFEPEYNRLKRDPAKLKKIYLMVTKRLGELKLKKEEKKGEKKEEQKKEDEVGAKKK